MTKEKIQQNQKWLDDVAIEVMKIYLSKKLPTGYTDSLAVSRVAYKQALAMLEVKESTEELAVKQRLI